MTRRDSDKPSIAKARIVGPPIEWSEHAKLGVIVLRNELLRVIGGRDGDRPQE